MKNIQYVLLGLLLTTLTCNDFLEENPRSQLTREQFYNNEPDFRVALTSTYRPLQLMYNNDIGMLTSVDTDEATVGNFPGGEGDDFQDHVYGPGSNTLNNWWVRNYNGINQANAIITQADQVNLPSDDQELVDRYATEAKFLRALYYFNLVLAFGDVPLNLEPTTSLNGLLLNRTDQATVYVQIEQDLQDAEAALPVSYENDEIGRVTSGAASAILAKVYLHQNKFQEARDKAQEVINSGEYGLFEDYLDVLSVAAKNGIEHIFSVQYARGLTESSMGRLYGFLTRSAPLEEEVPAEVRGQSAWAAEQGFFDAFPEGYRKEVSLVPRVVTGADTLPLDANFPHTRKYFDATKIDADGDNNANNYNIIRYADILLIFAEAENEISGPTAAAYDAINQIRRRAQQQDISTPDPTIDLAGLSADEFRDAVIEERRWELAYEGHRRWDLVRTGKYLAAVPSATARNVLFPIPQREIDLNSSLRQNDGY